ncbi:SEC10/PgrA surface exclusion domain-containing protein, partial [Streptococcus suis]|nr:SEC10/PgrA surface exclusion domain-containing protein [Streptococcus suis]
MGKKLIKSTAIGVATLSSFVIANGVHAEEAVNTPTSPVESPEVSLTASGVGIETVSGVIVTNGTAVVTETPTEATVDQATTIKTAADQAVTDQTAVVADATVAEEATAEAVDTATGAVADAEASKAEATDENIAKAEEAVEDTKTAISEAESNANQAAQNTAAAEAKVDEAQATVNSDQAAIDAQQTVVDNAKTAVDNAQAVLDGTGAAAIIAERDDAQADLTQAQSDETKAQSDLTKAQEADAKKASDLATAKETETVQSATANETASDLAQAQADATKAATDLVNANTVVDKAQKALDGTGAAAIIAERDDAQTDLTQAQADETKAQSDFTKAQAADAKKASDIASLTQAQTQQQATANQTAAALAQAQADAKTKAAAKTVADNKVAELTANIAAFDNLTTPKLSQDVIDAYKKFAKDDSQVNKDALFDAINTWYTTDMVGYTKTMVTPIDATVVDPANMTEEQVTALSHYYVHIGNAIRKQIWGANNEDFVVTKDAVQAAMQIAKNYTVENDNTGDHSYTALENDGNTNVNYASEAISYISSKTTTMTELYRKIYRMSIDTWAGDYNQDYAHITNEFWTRSISSSGSSSTTKLSGAFVTSVTLDGFGRSHEIQFLDNGGNTIASPYDTTALKAQLATAKTTQAQATAANTQAQSTLASATTANQQAQSALQATTNQLNTLKATADQT